MIEKENRMIEKEKYIEPEINVVQMSEDIIVASGGGYCPNKCPSDY